MPLLEEEYRKEEKINGVIYDMSPSPHRINSMLKFLIYSLKFWTKTIYPNNFTLKVFALKFDGYFFCIL